jgi:phosphoglycerol transferase MdoB-like AlkP superfamily enzyme
VQDNKLVHISFLKQFIAKLFLYLICIFFLFRVITASMFMPQNGKVLPLLGSFLMGIVYDFKWIAILLLPIVLFSFIFKAFNPYHNKISKWFWIVFLVLGSFLYLFMFSADFGHFAYVGTRLNASALNFFEDPDEMIGMLFQSYPMPLILGCLLFALIFVGYLYIKLFNKIKLKNKSTTLPFFAILAIVVFFVYGKPWISPLKRSDAMKVFNNKFNAYLALNPMQNFFTTLQMRKPLLKNNSLVNNQEFITTYFGQHNNASLQRNNISAFKKDTPVNIVVVLCESLSAYKTSLFGNALNTTPYLTKLANNGVLYDKCFTPHFGTARGLFALTTGIPDVQLSKFSSRNEDIINSKPCLFNELRTHEKYYFLGGSANFNNFRGIVNNINDVKIFERGSYKVPEVNTWGISDKQLFLAANEQFKNSSKPFAAIVQTSQNHRPYTVSAEDSMCTFNTYEKDSLKKYGFDNQNECNAMRLFDYSVEQFIETAKKEAYFKNTLFVFVGDHGIPGNANALFPNAWTTDKLSEEHVPLLFYAPNFLKPSVEPQVVSLIDVLPTALNIAGYNYTNTTMGRNVYNEPHNDNLAMIIYHDEGDYGLVSDSTYYTKSIDFKTEKLVPTIFTSYPWNDVTAQPLKNKYSYLADNYLDVARWCLINVKN